MAVGWNVSLCSAVCGSVEPCVIAEGSAEEVRASLEPYVHQFVWGEADGPVPFHYPAADYVADLLRGTRA